MIAAIWGLQAVAVALFLLTACVCKLARMLRHRSVVAALGATLLFPDRLRRPGTLALCAFEGALGLALLMTAGRPGARPPAEAVRFAAALFLLLAMGALVELRERRPHAGCGCFGGWSDKPPGARTVVRTGLLAGAALAAIHAPALRAPASAGGALALAAALAAECLALAAISPEPGEALRRLRHAQPCETRPLSLPRTMSALRRSAAWRRHAGVITGREPVDMWRELCWCYLAYAARGPGGDCAVVFAVEVKPRRPSVRVAVVPGGPAVPPGEDAAATLEPAAVSQPAAVGPALAGPAGAHSPTAAAGNATTGAPPPASGTF